MSSTAAHSDSFEPTYFSSLDGLRGFAALMVAYGHAGYFGWVPLVTGCATIGVILFFFLSGFLMGHHYMPSASQGSINAKSLKYWAAFLLRRFVRVYPPYFVAPVIGYLLLMPLMPPDFENSVPIGELSIIDELLKVATFDGNLGIYWTIEVELFFYAIYPLVITLCLLYGKKVWALFLLCIALMFFNHFPHGIGDLSWKVPLPGMWAGYISIFVAGILAAAAAKKIPNAWGGKPISWNRLALISFVAFILVVAVISQSHPTQHSIWQLEWLFALLFLVMFASLVRSDGIISRLLSGKISVILGKVSYSLYLVHIVAFHVVISRFPARLHGALTAILVLSLLCLVFYTLFERPFVRLSKRITVNGRVREPVSVGANS